MAFGHQDVHRSAGRRARVTDQLVVARKVLRRAVRSAVEPLELRQHLAADPYISEFVAGNDSGLVDNFGDRSDWIELYNPTATPVNLQGWQLTDDATRANTWAFPNLTLEGGAFLVVFASDRDLRNPAEPLHTDFKLTTDGEYLALLRPDNSVAHEFAPSFPVQRDDISYGARFTTGTPLTRGANAQVLVPSNGSLGTSWTQRDFDPNGWTTGPTGVGFGLSSIGLRVTTYKSRVQVSTITGAEQVVADPALQESSAFEVNTTVNYLNTGAGGRYANDRAFPGQSIGANVDDFVTVATATIELPTHGFWSFGVNSDEGFRLRLERNGVVHTSEHTGLRTAGDTIRAFNFAPDQVGPGKPWNLRLITFDRAAGGSVELFAAPDLVPNFDATKFRLVGDAANGGLPATTIISDGSEQLAKTDVSAQMLNVNASVYVRVAFTLSDPDEFESLALKMFYDDGFVAYLNGTEVARRNAPGAPGTAPSHNANATADRTGRAGEVERINVSAFRDLLVAGTNVLAIHGLNSSAADTDFLVLPELVGARGDVNDPRFFTTPTPGEPNSASFANFAAPVTFSVPHGIYTSERSVTLTSATPGATIRYTTDGSDPTLTNGTTYTAPVNVNRTTTLRSAAFKTDFNPSAITTQTYIFLADVRTQSTTQAPGPGWPAPGNFGPAGQEINYGMDPQIVNSGAWGSQVNPALTAIPTISVTTPIANLMSAATGIYVNAEQDGRLWERPASIELINPPGSTDPGFTINGGLRIRGGFSRIAPNPKHSFRLFFRDDYGDGNLEYPLFGAEGADEFSAVDLRTAQNYSWAFGGDPAMTMSRDVFSRDTMRDMGSAYTRSRYYHLYLDGQYWGIYQTEERPEADFAETYFEGDEGDFDVVKVERGPYQVQVTDGAFDEWTKFYQLAVAGFAPTANYYRVLGKNPDGTDNPDLPVYLDEQQLMDFMAVTYFGGNLDGPVSIFINNNNGINNFWALRNRNVGARQGWQFFIHDHEHSLLNVNENRLGPFGVGGSAAHQFNPQYLHERLMQNAEYRQKWFDRMQVHLFNGGALTTAKTRARFLARTNEIQSAIVAESARWGDSKREPALTKNDWTAARDNIHNNYLNQRSGIFLQHMRNIGWFPSFEAPVFTRNGAAFNAPTADVANGDTLRITASGVGRIFYTTDGSDPRLPGGGINPTAIEVPTGTVINLSQTTRLKARVLNGASWSALTDAVAIRDPRATPSTLALTEVNYNPHGTDLTLGETAPDATAYEFIEIANTGAARISLKDVKFTLGVEYTFNDDAVLEAGQRGVIVGDLQAFRSRYGSGPLVLGKFKGDLDGTGEQLRLITSSGVAAADFTFDDVAPWPTRADGIGSTIERVGAGGYGDPSSWRASPEVGGSPGAAPSTITPTVVINELLANTTSTGGQDAIELYNGTAAPVDLSGWYLSDNGNDLRKFRIPDETVLEPGAYLAYTEADFNPGGGAGPLDFALSSLGEELWLVQGDPMTGRLTRFADNVTFGPTDPETSLGRWPNGTGPFEVMAWKTFGRANSGPPGTAIPVVMDRHVFYNNSAADGNDPGAGTADDNAIAAGKQVLVSGAPTAANHTAIAKGVNGLMIDILGLPAGAEQSLTAADFTFRTGAGGDPGGWSAAPDPATIAIRRGAGAENADRVTLIWDDAAAVKDAWLQVTVNASTRTGLAAADVFYFGSLAGDATGDRTISVADVGVVSSNFGAADRAPETGDFTGDGVVTVADVGVLSTAFGRSLSVPTLSGGGGAGAAQSGTASSGTRARSPRASMPAPSPATAAAAAAAAPVVVDRSLARTRTSSATGVGTGVSANAGVGSASARAVASGTVASLLTSSSKRRRNR